MASSRSVTIFVALSVISFLVLAFGFRTVTGKKTPFETSGGTEVEKAELESVIHASEENLSAERQTYLRTLLNVADNARTDSMRTDTWQKISAFWFEQGGYTQAGYYAEKVAELKGDEESWGIAGSTYAIGVAQLTEDRLQSLCMERAEVCLENAISLDPENIDHRINLAICYVEYPPADSPMKGIQSLLSLNERYPDNTAVLYHLARFGIRTGQYDRAIERLTTAIELNPDDKRLYCLLARAYAESGNETAAAEMQAICNAQ